MKKKSILLYAPNINSGGGLVLLKILLESWDQDDKLGLILDYRARLKLDDAIKNKINFIYFVKKNIFSRIYSEIILMYKSLNYYEILCFHNIPPLFSKPEKLTIFIQNRLLIDNSININGITLRFYIYIQKLLIKYNTPKNVNFIVQSSSMKNLLYCFLGDKNKAAKIRVLPFFNLQLKPTLANQKLSAETSLIYPSEGYEYKNHLNLLQAWVLLADEGIFPILYLTISPNNKQLLEHIDMLNNRFNLKIINLGQVEHTKLIEFYGKVSALIFPSKVESFGLPLYEASMLGIPIIASELDYTRDACNPNETFDPNSSLSIARAIKRYMNLNPLTTKILGGKEFWNIVLEPSE